MFRIVRINGDSTVRLVLDNVVENKAPFNTNTLATGAEPKTLADFSTATILNTLNNWLDSNLNSYKDIIESEDFCKEIDFNDLNNGLDRTAAYTRTFINNTPSLMCESGVYNIKVGLLSVDEVTLAGAFQNNENRNYYLYNPSINGSYMLINPNYINDSNVVVIMSVKEDGSIEEGYLATDSIYFRPVINLSTSAKVKGKGTKDNPYIIVS